MTTVLGIDPGLEGALAILDNDGNLAVHDIPTLEIMVGKKRKRFIDHHALDNLFAGIRGNVMVVYLEQATSMPQQGVTSVFNFGVVFGSLRQALASHQFEIELVLPRVWKKALHLRKGKDASLQRASELLPKHWAMWNLKKHHNRAEAALIAWYGLQQIGARHAESRGTPNTDAGKPTRRRLKRA